MHRLGHCEHFDQRRVGWSRWPSRLSWKTCASGRVRLASRSIARISAKPAAKAASAALFAGGVQRDRRPSCRKRRRGAGSAGPARAQPRPRRRRRRRGRRGRVAGRLAAGDAFIPASKFGSKSWRRGPPARQQSRFAVGEDQRHALRAVVVDDDAVHALETFVVENRAARCRSRCSGISSGTIGTGSPHSTRRAIQSHRRARPISAKAAPSGQRKRQKNL